MKFITSLHAYDCLGDVVYAVRVRRYGDYEDGESELVLAQGGTFPGEGIDDPQIWLRDILVHLAERL